MICFEATGEGGTRKPVSSTNPLPVTAVISANPLPVTAVVTSTVATPVAPASTAGAGGKTLYSNTALTNTKQQVKGSAASLYGWHIYNPNAAVTYVQIFNALSASVTVGTTAPDMVIGVPANSAVSLNDSLGLNFATGLTIAATTTFNGSTAPATQALVMSLYYS
jgi:hypothetical protein